MGRPPLPLIHGTRTGYAKGCRCDECRAAQRESVAAYRATSPKYAEQQAVKAERVRVKREAERVARGAGLEDWVEILMANAAVSRRAGRVQYRERLGGSHRDEIYRRVTVSVLTERLGPEAFAHSPLLNPGDRRRYARTHIRMSNIMRAHLPLLMVWVHSHLDDRPANARDWRSMTVTVGDVRLRVMAQVKRGPKVFPAYTLR